MQTSHIIQHATLTFDIHLCQMFANLKFFNLTVSTFKRTTLINRVWLIQQLIHLQPLQVHCIIKVTLYLGIQWMYNSLQCIQNRKKPLRLISYRAISHTGFVYPTTWGNSPCSVRYRAEGGSLPSYTPTVPPAQRWLFRETCVSRAKDKAGVLNAFIQFNPLPRETIELDGRPIETSISKNYSCKLWKFCFFVCLGFFLAPLLLSVSHQKKMQHNPGSNEICTLKWWEIEKNNSNPFYIRRRFVFLIAVEITNNDSI